MPVAPESLRIDTFPTPFGCPRPDGEEGWHSLALGRRIEAVGLEVFLENGITRAGWLVVPGETLSVATTRAAERVRWSWELWPWPRAFLARMACLWARNRWTDVHGGEIEWFQRPPPPFGFEPTPSGEVPERGPADGRGGRAGPDLAQPRELAVVRRGVVGPPPLGRGLVVPLLQPRKRGYFTTS
jgi:hypothetical protein